MSVSVTPDAATWRAIVLDDSREDGDQLSAPVMITDGSTKFMQWFRYDGTAEDLSAKVVAWIQQPRDPATSKRTRVAATTELALVFPDRPTPTPPTTLPEGFTTWRPLFETFRRLTRLVADGIPGVTPERVADARAAHEKQYDAAFEDFL